MKISCGTLLLDTERQLLLLGHVTGQPQWDLPKGVKEEVESERACAAREAFEEFGIELPQDALVDMGEHPYLPKKRLHLFALACDSADYPAHLLQCTSEFKHPLSGRMLKEIDAHKWVPLTALEAHLSKVMKKVLLEQGLLSAALQTLSSPKNQEQRKL